MASISTIKRVSITINTYQPPKKGGIMNFFNRQGWGRMPLSLVAAAVAVFAGGAVAQNSTDTAYVPFIVNVDATVKAVQGTGSGSRTVSMQVSAGEESILRLPLGKTVGVAYAAPGRANAPVITNSRGGKITLNLPAQSYKNAEISLYSVNGKRIMRQNISASSAVNDIARQNAAPGAYLLSVKGSDGNAVNSRLTHRGGEMNIAVVFGGAENASTPARLSKKAADGDWTVTVSAEGYTNASYTFVPVAGENSPHNITLSTGYGAPAYVTAAAASTESITLTWSAVSGATTYRVYSSASSDGTYSLIGSVPAPTSTFTHTGLTSVTTYYYRISAFSSSGESARSSPVSARTAFLDAPSGVAVSPIAGGNTVTWSSVSGAEGYNLYVRTSENGAYRLLETTTSLSNTLYTHEGLEWNATYYYKVAAYNGDGEGVLSSGIAAKTIYGALTDARDNKKYKKVIIGNQTWMAENLNYEAANGTGSSCSGNDPDNCTKYGRLYDWTTAMDVEALFNENLWGGSDVKHQGICPTGWHLPSRQEWGELAIAAGGTGTYGSGGNAGKKLKSTSGWSSNANGTNGTDDFGFSALPNLYQASSNYGAWWTATENQSNQTQAYSRSIFDSTNTYVYENNQEKWVGYSVRCVGD
jgi:uncharacterized protein (TIGR02145 family)